MSPPELHGLAGALQGGAVLLLETRLEDSALALSGPQASWARYSARTVLEEVDLGRLRTNRLRSLRADFFGIGRWAGMEAGAESWETDGHGITRGFSLALSARASESRGIGNGLSLSLSSAWSVRGPQDQRVIGAPVSIGCEAARPVPTWTLLQPLLRVQDLVSLAYEGTVLAEAGGGVPDLTPGIRPGIDVSRMWNGVLMTLQRGGLAASLSSFPLFTLGTIGGMTGLKRWIDLARTHPRAVAPLAAPLRHGFSSADVVIRDVAAAMEYWVRSNRPAQWASTKLFAQALTGRLGPAFTNWVGNSDEWSKEFWNANTHLKHEPRYTVDDRRLIDLALSGRYVLLASLLNRLAGNRKPSEALFSNHRLASLGERLRT